MRWVLRFPPLPPTDAQQRWTKTRWGTFDLGWAVDGVRLIPLPGRWALQGFWFDGEPETDLLDEEVEFDTAEEAIEVSMKACLPVWDDATLLVEPLPQTSSQALSLRQWRLAHLAERIRAIDALIEQHPCCLSLHTTREALLQRWRRVAGPRRRGARRERSDPSS